MCFAGEGPCVELGPPENWSRRAPLPPPEWLRDDVRRFADAARLAAAGDLDTARARFAQLRDADARHWYVQHAKQTYCTRRSPAAIERVTRTAKVPRPYTPVALRRQVFDRDHFVCRYCGLSTIDSRVPKILRDLLGPEVVSWGASDRLRQGTALAAWTQYDHVVPIAMHGRDEEQNLVTACACCNFGKDQYTLAELGLDDPRDRLPIADPWDGLTSLLPPLRLAQRRSYGRP